MVLGVGALLALVVGLFSYRSLTATPLHSDARGVPSEARSAPAPEWTAAVEHGRQIARAGIIGLSSLIPGRAFEDLCRFGDVSPQKSVRLMPSG